MSSHVDLTADTQGDSTAFADTARYAKRPRTDAAPWVPQEATPSPSISQVSSTSSAMFMPNIIHPPYPTPFSTQFFGFRPPPPYRPIFAGNAPYSQNSNHSGCLQPSGVVPHQPQVVSPRPSQPAEPDIIDLTSSPSPPPPKSQVGPSLSLLPADLPPKTPVCIGQLAAAALILYPEPYTLPQGSGEPEWVPVRLHYEHDLNTTSAGDNIRIKLPSRAVDGSVLSGDGFGLIEQKVADSLGPMLARGLIRLEGKIRRGSSSPLLPIQMLVLTPKGNIPVVGKYLRECNLLLDNPAFPFDPQRITYHYCNPHNPLPEGHIQPGTGVMTQNRWQTVAGKSVEVHRSQIDDLFQSLKDGSELSETEPCSEISTKLYPHQKKALTFLLDREKEAPASDSFSSLWQTRGFTTDKTSWFNVVTQKEVHEAPKEAKGAILADDMGLGKTITCVSLIGSTLNSAMVFAASPLESVPLPLRTESLTADHFADCVWGMPPTSNTSKNAASAKAKAKAERMHSKQEAEYARHCRIKVKSRATLIICPLSTVSNWEDQFREHWGGGVAVVGGGGSACALVASQTSAPQSTMCKRLEAKVREERSLRIYIYHGNARRPDPSFLASFDAVITTYATLATEFSRQTKSLIPDDDDEDEETSIPNEFEFEGMVDPTNRPPKVKISNGKRKKAPALAQANNSAELSSALQSIHWFRVVLDEAHYIKETGTVACRACCDLMADRRLCLTGTPVQNKLDDVFALIKFLRLQPFDDKSVWTEYIGSPVKYGQALGVARLQTIMKCITLRRTKETKESDGATILSLPPRRDELRFLRFDSQEQDIYDRFFKESKDEFTDLSNKNEVMKNYVGILQRILRLRQICDHFELVDVKQASQGSAAAEYPGSHEDTPAAIATEGFNSARAFAMFAILRESATAQCVECACELGVSSELGQDSAEAEVLPPPLKRGRKCKSNGSRSSTRANSPSVPRPILTRCQHLFCAECYQSSICPDWPKVSPDIIRSCSACQTALSPTDAFEIKWDSYCQKKKVQKRERRQKGQSSANFVASTKIKSLLQDLVRFSSMNPHSANYDLELEMTDSSGITIDPDIVKTVVFSQWTSMLDKVEDALELARIRYDRLDGTMKREERVRAMDSLKHDPGCEVLLVSLKAGGVGLNLTAAQRVYLLDPYWNPAVENQAVDRIHRLGQTRPVTTVKLIIENSIEARLLEVQKRKTALANMTLNQNFTKAEILQRRMAELTELFGS